MLLRRLQEAPFQQLNRLLADFQKYSDSLDIPVDPATLPLSALPWVGPESSRLEFAVVADGLFKYVKEEASKLLNPQLCTEVDNWLTSMMPLSFEDMSSLYARIDVKNPNIARLLDKMHAVYGEYDRVASFCENQKTPMVIKVCSRINLMAAVAALIAGLSGEFYKLREGIA